MAMQLPNLGPRARKVLRYGGFALLGLVTFVFAFQMTFPFGRVKAKIIEALSEKYEVSIADVERGLIPGRVYFKGVSLRTRPAKPGDLPSTLYVERLEVDLGLLALLRGTVSVDLDAKIGPGHIAGEIALSKRHTSIDIVGEDVPSASLPTREVLGLPMSGKLGFSFALELPNEKAKTGKVGPNWAKATGAASLACPSGCTVGDGKTKLKLVVKNPRQQAFAEGGIDFGKVNIDKLLAKLEIKRGKMTITQFDTKSSDGEVHVDFDMTLNQDLNQSLVTGCLRFRGSEALLKREPKTHAALSTTGGPLGPDNLFHIKLDGPLRELKRLPQVCGSAVNTSMDNPGGSGNSPARPNLNVTPEPPVQPAAAPAPIPSPDSPPPPPVTPPAPPEGAASEPTVIAPPPQPGQEPGSASPSPAQPAPDGSPGSAGPVTPGVPGQGAPQ